MPMDLPRADDFPFAQGPVWVSASGRAIGNTVTRATGSFVRLAVLDAGSIRVQSELLLAPYVVPGPEGKEVYVGGYGEQTTDFKASNGYGRGFDTRSDRAYQIIPSHTKDFFVILHLGVHAEPFYPSAKKTTKGLTIWHREQRKEVAMLEDMPELSAELSGSATLPMLVHFVPDAGVVVALSPKRDRVAVYPARLAGIGIPQKKPIAWKLPSVPAPVAIAAHRRRNSERRSTRRAAFSESSPAAAVDS